VASRNAVPSTARLDCLHVRLRIGAVASQQDADADVPRGTSQWNAQNIPRGSEYRSRLTDPLSSRWRTRSVLAAATLFHVKRHGGPETASCALPSQSPHHARRVALVPSWTMRCAPRTLPVGPCLDARTRSVGSRTVVPSEPAAMPRPKCHAPPRCTLEQGSAVRYPSCSRGRCLRASHPARLRGSTGIRCAAQSSIESRGVEPLRRLF
jgi:hypothetical protein